MPRRGLYALVAVVAFAIPAALLVLAACQPATGQLGNGTYRAFAASPGIEPLPDAQVSVSDETIRVTESGVTTTVSATAGTQEYVLCPPDGRGTPNVLGPALTIGGVSFERPALIPDCGVTTPKRITLVDESSVEDRGSPFPFARWIEFCDTTDPDC